MATKTPVKYANTNIEKIGSLEDLHARLKAAGTEPAWANAGKKEGLEIWRVEKFKIVPWPKDQYGVFMDGDSYIVMNTYKNSPTTFGWDIHFWLGKYTTMDEAGTAAYKTVELDDFLGGGPVEYREVMGFESTKFLKYFGGKVATMPGGIESGFHHVSKEPTVPVLFWVKGGKKHIRVKKADLKRESLNSGDVFILSSSEGIIQWNGKQASVVEKTHAQAICHTLQHAFTAFPGIRVIEENDQDAKFWGPLGGFGPVAGARAGGADEDINNEELKTVLYRLSDASGKLVFSHEGTGKLQKAKLLQDDVFVVDVGTEVYVWIGRGATARERKNAMTYAQQYLAEHKRPAQLAIIKVLDGREPPEFWSAFNF